MLCRAFLLFWLDLMSGGPSLGIPQKVSCLVVGINIVKVYTPSVLGLKCQLGLNYIKNLIFSTIE